MIPGQIGRRAWLAACVAGVCLVTTPAQAGPILTPLLSFTGTNGAYPGANPDCGLALGPDGNFYGTTSAGGSNDLGTVFRVSPDGTFTSLVSFDGANGADPQAALTPGGDGALYGTTYTGGASNWGTIFLITTNGAFTNLFSFIGTSHPEQGANPAAALVPDGAGNFYGTADYGGPFTNAIEQGYGYGTVFKLAGDGAVTVPAVFSNTNGAHPSGGLVPGRDGNFYGTTTWGGRGISGSFPGFGTIFKMSPAGVLTNLYRFTGSDDGGFIYAGLAQGRNGFLYGAAFGGGANGYGTLFKISTNGDFTWLHAFASYESGSPVGGLMEGSDGNFYGTTYGAYAGYGTVFRLSPDGAFTNLIFFNSVNGAHPEGVLLQGPDNNFYGTTSLGGANGLGTIFRLRVPLPPVIQTIAWTDGAVTFTWSAVAGLTYRSQYSTNLAQTDWINLTKPIIATGGTMSATDHTATGSPQRFYRALLLPP